MSGVSDLYLDTFADEDFIEYVEDFDEYELGIDKYEELMNASIQDIAQHAEWGSQGIKVYRLINLKDVAELNTENIGQSWTYKKSSAHGWYGGDGESYILCAEMPVGSVDAWRSLRQNIISPDEKELGLEEGEPIYLMTIEDMEGNVQEDFNGLKCTTKEGNFGEYTG